MKIQSGLAAFDRAIAKKYNGTEPNGAGQYYLDWKYNLADEKDYIEQLADKNDLSVEFQSDEGYFEVFSSRKPIKSDLAYEDTYLSEFDEMVKENGYNVNEKFTYMAGVTPDVWSQEDTDAANSYNVEVAGYYKLGDNEGMVLVGTLQNIYEYCDGYWGMGLHPDYVCPADSFDYEDGEWVTGGWIDSSHKPIKSSYVINYYDEAGYVEDNFIDANAKGLVSSPVGAMTFDTMEDAQFWIDTQAADNLFDPEYCEIQPVDDEIESACHGKSKKAKKPVKSGRYIKSGAGAGYDVTIEGLELDIDNFKVLERDEESIHVQVPVKPCVVDKWKAADYYNSVSSDGIEIDNIPVMDYGNDDKKVDSGFVNITIDIWENDDYSTDESIRDTLPSTIDFTASYGWGWIHPNLPEDGMHFDYESIKEPDIGAYGEMHIDEIDLKCPNICEDINWFFAHDHELEEIFFGDDEDNE